ncbi:hypothetical protein [Rhizomonospora bruguierae]|uniref:hypothetical protein n=1 Tax=Rhizomonospora bruguierae TaxID=1581705 RepID=UPI0020BFEC7B|nr:hypothetical protein [Micromonospora sp. NBRC 107566]
MFPSSSPGSTAADPAPHPGAQPAQPGGDVTPPGGAAAPVPDDPDLAPTERARLRVRSVPIRRLLSLAVAGFAALLCVGLTVGAQTAGPGAARWPYAVVIFGVQVMFVLVWAMAMRPPGAKIVAGTGVLAAAGADVAAVYPKAVALAPLAYVAAAAVAVAALGQLIRRGRAEATESMSATLITVIGVVSFATLVVCTRLAGGTQAITVCLTAIGVALAVAHGADTVVPAPRLSPQVPRGAAGVVVGAMAGTLAAAVLGKYLVGFDPGRGAVAGLVAAAAAVLADLSVAYAEAGRQMAGQRPTFWVARHMQGPLGGFALAAPVAYVVSVLFLVP